MLFCNFHTHTEKTYFSNLLSRFCQGVCRLWRRDLERSGSTRAVTDTEMGVQLFNTSQHVFQYSERFWLVGS